MITKRFNILLTINEQPQSFIYFCKHFNIRRNMYNALKNDFTMIKFFIVNYLNFYEPLLQLSKCQLTSQVNMKYMYIV